MKENNDIRYHKTEDAWSTVINPDEYPFWITQFGITNEDSFYHQIRLKSDITCVEYIISGSGIIISNDHSFIVNKGDTYMLTEGSDVNYYSNMDDPFKKIWINVKGVLAKEIIRIYKLSDTVLFRNVCSHDIIKSIHDVCKKETDPQILQDKGSQMFLGLIQFLYRNQRKITVNSDMIDVFRYYIDCHITENIKLADVAKIAHMSVDHAIRVFKKRYGVTPHQYILKSKMIIAALLLQSTDKSIAEIAESLSFSDPHNFSAVFQKYEGVRPSEYRKSFFRNKDG